MEFITLLKSYPSNLFQKLHEMVQIDHMILKFLHIIYTHVSYNTTLPIGSYLYNNALLCYKQAHCLAFNMGTLVCKSNPSTTPATIRADWSADSLLTALLTDLNLANIAASVNTVHNRDGVLMQTECDHSKGSL